MNEHKENKRKDLHEVSIKLSFKLIEILGTEDITKNIEIPPAFYMRFNDEFDIIVREYLGRIKKLIDNEVPEIKSSNTIVEINKILRLDV